LQNWTPTFLEQFRSLRGYDPVPYLPALAGHVVDGAEVSDRFLWDVRRTIADLVAENHYGVFRERLSRLGMGLYSEAVGLGMPITAAQWQTRGRADIPRGEFWLGKESGPLDNAPPDCKEAASGGHVYGKNIIAAESFTAAPDIPSWGRSPYDFKAIG